MSLSKKKKENIKTYFLIKEGLEITEITEFYDYLLLKPYGGLYFEDKIYTNKQIQQILYLCYKNITDISPLSSLTNLKGISLENNKILDISPLSNLTALEVLYLGSNNITDISSLSNLSNLTHLYLSYNKIKDISPLSNLSNLKALYLSYNKITDISHLSNLSLEILYLWENNNIPKEQIKELKLKLPYCRCYYT